MLNPGRTCIEPSSLRISIVVSFFLFTNYCFDLFLPLYCNARNDDCASRLFCFSLSTSSNNWSHSLKFRNDWACSICLSFTVICLVVSQTCSSSSDTLVPFFFINFLTLRVILHFTGTTKCLLMRLSFYIHITSLMHPFLHNSRSFIVKSAVFQRYLQQHHSSFADILSVAYQTCQMSKPHF